MEHNRKDQQKRNRRRYGQDTDRPPVAKMDVSISERSIIPGRYLLSRVESDLIAKMDALIVELKFPVFKNVDRGSGGITRALT